MNAVAAPTLASIIINNYNYGRYLPEAIQSALCQTYAPVEVIVVDDGSTDHSVDVLQSFGGQVTAVYKVNEGQASAVNAGFARSHGDVIIFLDADDILAPQAVERVVASLESAPEAIRVQYRMEVIGADGRRTGEIKPAGHIPARSGDLRQHVLSFPFDMPWLPTSGNAFRAGVLKRIFPIPLADFRILADYYLSNITPLFGPVLFLDEVLACYRVHGSNSFEQLNSELDLDHIRKTLIHAGRTRTYLLQYAQQLGLAGKQVEEDDILSVAYLANRLVSLKLEPEAHPVRDDAIHKIVFLGIKAASRRFDVNLLMRLLFAFWFVWTAILPRRISAWTAQYFFYPQKRGGLNKLLGAFHQA